MAALFLLALAVGLAQAALYSSNDAVVQLNEQNFEKVVMQTPGVAAVEFYAPWCGHCQALAPHWKKAASSLKGMATVGAVDCDDKANSKLCGRYKISSLPTIKLFGPDQELNPYTKELHKEASDYRGARTAKAIVEMVLDSYTDSRVTILESKSGLTEFVQSASNSQKPAVVLLSQKSEVASLYKALSTQLRGRMAFAQVHVDSSADIVKALGAEEPYPALYVYKAGEDKPTLYEGELKAASLQPYLVDLAGGLGGTEDVDSSSSSASSKAGGRKGGSKDSDEPSEAPVVVSNITLADAKVLDSQEEMAVLGLHAGTQEACAPLEEGFTKVMAELGGMVRAATVRLSTEELSELAVYGVDPKAAASEAAAEGCAQRIVLLPFGAEKQDLEEYQVYTGPLEAKELGKWIGDAMPDLTMEVVAQNYQAFMTLKGGQGDGVMTSSLKDDDEEEVDSKGRKKGKFLPPKLLLITNKDTVPGVFKALALNFKKRAPYMAFGWTSAEHEDASVILNTIKPPKVPGVLMLLPIPVPSEDGDTDKYSMSAQPYNGPVKYGRLSAWLSALLDGYEHIAGIAAAAPVELPQLASQASFEEHCVSKGVGVCVVGLLDGNSKASWEGGVTILSSLAGSRKEEPLYFSYLDARKYRAFSNALGVMGSDLPTAVVLSAKKLRYAVLPARLVKGSESELSRFIDSVLRGAVRTQPLDALPAVSEGGAGSGDFDSTGSGGGANGIGSEAGSAEPPVEDEFDLSDIMNEEVEGDEAVLSTQEKLRRAEEALKAEAEAKAKAEAEAKKKKQGGTKKKSAKKAAAAAEKSKEEL